MRYIILVLFILSSNFLHIEADLLACSNCFQYNNNVCISFADCYSNLCLYEQIINNGQIYTKKTCADQSYYTYPDGTTSYLLNQCVSKYVNGQQYYTKVCDNGNYCNTNCGASNGVTPPPWIPQTPNTLPPITEGIVTCYNCVSTDGTDCQTGTCQGRYCTYQRRLSNNQLYIKKSCSQTPFLQLDDGTVVETLDVCEIRNTQTSQYYVKICNDVNLCNNYCNPGTDTGTEPPQRQNLVTCYSCEQNDNDCFSGSCQGNYCLYERQRSLTTGRMYYRKSCSQVSYIEYPDGTFSSTTNQCEQRNINNVEYQVSVCNNGNRCNSACSTTSGPLVTCAKCNATNQLDCSGTTCQGRYCLFERQYSTSNNNLFVSKSCTNNNVLQYPDNTLYHSMEQCEYKNINDVSYSVKLCSTANCNTACADNGSIPPSATTSPPSQLNAASFISTISFSIICLILTLL